MSFSLPISARLAPLSQQAQVSATPPEKGTFSVRPEGELSVLQKWAAQHRIERNPSNPKALTAGKVALTALVYVGLFFARIGQGIMAMTDWIHVKIFPQSTLAAIRNMKKQEETDKLQTMKKVLSDPKFKQLEKLSASEAAKELSKPLDTRLRTADVVQNKGARHILRALSQKESFNPQWMKALGDKKILQHLNFDSQGISDDFIAALKEHYPALNAQDVKALDWQAIAQKTKENAINPQDMQKEIRMYERSLNHLLEILKNPKQEGNATEINRDLIATLRKALSSPVYQALKEDLNDPSVQLLQRIASDMWNKAPSMDAYRDVGANIVKKMKIKEKGNQMSGRVLAHQLEKSHKPMSKAHFTDHGIPAKILYGLTHPDQALGSAASEGGKMRDVAAVVGRDVYDSHGQLSNNPSLQGTTSLSLDKGKKAEIRNCYGGSPTIGDHDIAPEFEAAIQAAENNQMAPPESRDKNIPMMVNYNNLQDLDKRHGEGPRSRTIMLLNDKYPLSFRGATFAKDSSLYMMKEARDIVFDKRDPAAFGDVMLKQLRRSFDPNQNGHGFYFHGSPKQWAPIFKGIIGNANRHFEALQKDQQLWQKFTEKQLQGAYQEYVYSLLNSVIEMESVKGLASRGIDRPTVMVITACKENIDRGGMENTKYLYNRLSETAKEDRLPLIMGAMHSRALSARDRIILKKRMPQVLDYMRTTSPLAFRKNQRKLLRELGYGVSNSEFRPHLKERMQGNPPPKQAATA